MVGCTTYLRSIGVGCSTYRWLKRLRDTPNSMWMTPRITDIFILNEFRKVSLLVATFQICRDDNSRVKGQGVTVPYVLFFCVSCCTNVNQINRELYIICSFELILLVIYQITSYSQHKSLKNSAKNCFIFTKGPILSYKSWQLVFIKLNL